VPYFRKRPVVVQAVRWNGENEKDVEAMTLSREKWRVGGRDLIIATPEGVIVCAPGAWVVQGPGGELYPCQDRFFAETYEPVHGPA
jgi:hypothetical protein